MRNYTINRNIILILLSCLFFAYGIWVIWRLSFIAIDGLRYFSVSDDALITFRYGWNLGHGNGMVWNKGEKIEGVTTQLWTIFSAIMSILLPKRIIPLAAQITGIVCVLGTCLVFVQIIKDLSRNEDKNLTAINEFLAFLIPLSYYPLIYWSARAMETGLQALLVSIAVWQYVRNPKNEALVGVLFLGLAYLTRPDNIIPAVIIFLFRGFYVFKRKLSLRVFTKELILYLSILFCSIFFRIIYYEEIVPNTYLLKVSGMSILDRIQLNGIGYIKPFIQLSIPIFLLVLIGLLIKPGYHKFLFAALSSVPILYVVFIGGDAFPLWRFNSPFMPFIFLILLFDLPDLINYLTEIFKSKAFAKQRLLFLVLIYSGIILTVGRPPINYYYEQNPQPDDILNINRAIILNKILEPDASVGVFYAGAIPFYSDFYAVDFLGKTDPIIANFKPDISGAISWNNMKSVPGHNKYDLVYSILGKKPTYIAGMEYGSQDLSERLSDLYFPVPINIEYLSTSYRDTLFLLEDSEHVRWSEIPKFVEFSNKIFSIDPSIDKQIDVSEEYLAEWGLEKQEDDYFLWLGEGTAEGFRALIWSQEEYLVHLIFHFIPGPSREDQLRHVEITYLSANAVKGDSQNIKIFEFDQAAEYEMDVRVEPGVNELLISVVDIANIETLPNGDTRPLLVQLRNIDLRLIKQ